MATCTRCGGTGVLRTEKGLAECMCKKQERLGKYLAQLVPLVEDREKAAKEVGRAGLLEDRTLAFLRNDRNMLGLLKTAIEVWYPQEYRIVSVMDLNAIEFGRWEEFKSVHDLIVRTQRVIIDARLVGKKRDPKMRELDGQILIEAMRTAMIEHSARIIVLLPSTLRPVEEAYPELLRSWNELGELYWRNGKVGKFQINDENDASAV